MSDFFNDPWPVFSYPALSEPVITPLAPGWRLSYVEDETTWLRDAVAIQRDPMGIGMRVLCNDLQWRVGTLEPDKRK